MAARSNYVVIANLYLFYCMLGSLHQFSQNEKNTW